MFCSILFAMTVGSAIPAESGVHLRRQGVAGPPQYVQNAARKSMHGLAEKFSRKQGFEKNLWNRLVCGIGWVRKGSPLNKTSSKSSRALGGHIVLQAMLP